MSTDIIVDQFCITFPLAEVINDYNQHYDKTITVNDLHTEFSRMFGGYDDLYLYLESSYSSNVTPRTPSWFNCVPVSGGYQLVCNYINKALTSFEGGMSRFAGGRHTKPETALSRLRKRISEALNISDFVKFNPQGLSFTFNLFDSHTSEIDEEDRQLFDKLIDDMDLKIPQESNQRSWQGAYSGPLLDCKKAIINVKHPRDIIKVVVLSNISEKYNKVSHPALNAKRISKPTKSVLEMLV